MFLYEGYNDLMGDPKAPNVSIFRHESPVFRLTGYLPIFPIVFKEKAASMLSGGDPGALYRLQGKTVFRPNIATQAAAGVLRTTAEIGQSLERQLGRATPEPLHRMDEVNATGCKHPWEQVLPGDRRRRTDRAGGRSAGARCIAAVRARREPPPPARGTAA